MDDGIGGIDLFRSCEPMIAQGIFETGPENKAIVVKVAWEAQIPAETGGRDDLVNYERNQVRAQFAWDF
jgi:hypothetical protein